MLTSNKLKEVLNYDPDSGIFTWLVSRGRCKVGSLAGTVNKYSSYGWVKVFGKPYQAHRLAWLYVYGDWPAFPLDHINGIPSDNRMVNLRMSTLSENQHNRRMNKNNSSGFFGVSWDKEKEKWSAWISSEGKAIYLGLYSTPVLASAAYVEAKKKLHPTNPEVRIDV